MKKLVLSALFASALLVVSCQKKEPVVEESVTTEETVTTDPVTETTTTETTTETTLEVPKFASSDMQKYAEQYTAYVQDVAQAAKEGNTTKVAELQGKATEWATNAQKAAANLTAEDAKLWADYSAKLTEQLQSATVVK